MPTRHDTATSSTGIKVAAKYELGVSSNFSEAQQRFAEYLSKNTHKAGDIYQVTDQAIVLISRNG